MLPPSLVTASVCAALILSNVMLTCDAAAIEKRITYEVSSQQEIAEKLAKEQMERLLTQYNLPSFSMAISVNGELVFAKAIGFSDTETNVLATPMTQYSEILSMTLYYLLQMQLALLVGKI